MGTLQVNKEFIRDFISGQTPCMTLGLAVLDGKKVIFLGLRPEGELAVSGTDVGAALIPIPNQTALQFHFITDSNTYFYCLLNPASKHIKSILSHINSFDIFFMIIQPDQTGSSGLLPIGSDIHLMLSDRLHEIDLCDHNNDISEVSHLADNFLGMMGKQLNVRCLSEIDNYDYFSDFFTVRG